MSNEATHIGRRVVLGLIACAFALPAFAYSDSVGSKPIDKTEYVSLGGIEQWISAKGDDSANPVLLVVHGGPGETQWPNADKYTPWQKDFTVVLWDQRGTGHTYSRSGRDNTPNVTLARIAEDGVALAEYLRSTFGKRKIIVLGHSWGSLVAITMVRARPDLFAAYVGTGQAVSWAGTVQRQFDMLLAKARAEKDQAGIAKLEAIGKPDPKNANQYFGFLNALNYRSSWAPSDQAWIAHLRAQAPTFKGNKDFEDSESGMEFSGNRLISDEIATDLPKTATHIDTAFFVIQGRDDAIAPTAGVIDYFGKVQAPYKDLTLIPNAGHFALLTNGTEFLKALTDKVRPIAIRNGA